jgi:hypothetical protein
MLPTLNQCDCTATPISPVTLSRATIEYVWTGRRDTVCAASGVAPSTTARVRPADHRCDIVNLRGRDTVTNVTSPAARLVGTGGARLGAVARLTGKP